jgi:hypothetical protein
MEKQKIREIIEFVRKIIINGLNQDGAQDNKGIICLVAVVIIEEKDALEQPNVVGITSSGINKTEKHKNKLADIEVVIGN